MLGATLLLPLLLCPPGGRGEGEGGAGGAGLTGPLSAGEPLLGGPEQVRFQAETFLHLLRWEPGVGEPPGARYEVQHKRYGHRGWSAALHCSGTGSRHCDLTGQTLGPQLRYFARVRALMGNRTSRWTQTASPFSPKDATLRLAGLSLAVAGNRIHMTLRLPVYRWGNNNVTCEDIHGRWLEFHVSVRRASDGHQFVYVGTSLEFDLPPLLWGERYCVSVEPQVASQPSPGRRTEEQCLSIPSAEDQARTVVPASLALLSLAALGTLATAWTWLYVKKPGKTPSVLKSPLRSGSPWRPNELPAWGMKDQVLCVEAESVQRLSLSPKNCTETPGWSQPSAGAAPPPPEESPWLPAQRAGAEPKGLEDSSGCSLDSGICLREGSGSLRHFLDCRRPSLGSSRVGGGVQAGTEVGSPQLLPPAAFSSLEAEGRADPAQVLFSGYQKQLASCKPLAGTDQTSHSQPGLARGYMKQLALAAPSGLGDTIHTQDVPARTPQFADVPSCALWPFRLPPDCPKAALAGSCLESPAPPLSLWHLSTQLSQDLGLPRCRMSGPSSLAG